MRSSALLVLILSARFALAGDMTARRLPGNPIVTSASSTTLGDNINGPSLIRVPKWIRHPLGRYYLYFAHHEGQSIRLAYADRLSGPWRIYEPGTLQLAGAPSCADHVASPDVHVDAKRKQIVMYFHCPYVPLLGTGIDQQKTFLARSSDGLNFTAEREPLGPAYFRVFEWRGTMYAVARGGIVFRSTSAGKPFEKGPTLFPDLRLRHAAVEVRGDKLYVYYSRIGDKPERILVATVALSGNWRRWRASKPMTLLAPATAYEGADRPIEASRLGDAEGVVHQLRDPAIFREGTTTYLLYSIAGESGIAIAEITP